MKLDSLHFALLVAIVLLAIYAFGSFREEMHIPPETPFFKDPHLPHHHHPW
jgi:hypothetical protein